MSVTVVGDALVDLIVPIQNIKRGETYHRNILMLAGGLSNVAIEISKLGIKVKFLGKVGNDPFGRYFKQILKENEIEDLTFKDPKLPTGLCICLVYENGERTMIASRGANDNITIEDIKQHIERIKSSKIAYFSGYSLLKEKTRSSILYCMKECHSAGVRIFFNPGAPNLIRKKFFEAIKNYVDVLILNQDEAMALTCGSRDLRCLSNFVKLAVVTRGPNGCTLVRNGEIIEIDTEKLNVKNTTGAGDAFAAGFIAGKLKGLNDVECGRLGNETAAKFLVEREGRLK